jgi:aerobic C4-dicarboxylate transport protein
MKPKSLYQQLYFQTFAALLLGIAFGCVWPDLGVKMKPLGDAFINLVKMLIGPIIFCTVVHGVASMGDLRKLGRVGGKTLLYFEAVSTLALFIGLVVVNVLKPGAGFNIDPATLDPNVAKNYIANAHTLSTVDFLMNLIPKTFFSAFVSGDLLQVLVVAGLVALAIQGLGDRGKPALRAIESGSEIFFGIMRLIVKFAPIGVFGAMAFTIGSEGVRSLMYLFDLIAGFYLTTILFIVVVLGSIGILSGFSIFRFLVFIKEELVLVLGTSSSETALPGLIHKMKRLGCAESTVGLVIPTGYSFNLDGTNIYMTMAAIFLAQATNTAIDLGHQISLLLAAMITSKGASGVTGAGFVCLAATLAVVPSVPIQSLALLVGIDRLMSQCRSFTNLIGNGVATVVISRWEREISADELNANLRLAVVNGVTKYDQQRP